MGRTITAVKALCLILLALYVGLTDSSRGEAPAPQDSLWSQQWNMKNTGQFGGTAGIDVGLLGAWDFTTGSDQVTVAVIGEAASAGHPDFIPAIGNIRIDPEGLPGQRGASIAGIIAAEANNGEMIKRGIAGMDQARAVLTYQSYSSSKIYAAAAQGADVIQLVLTDDDADEAEPEAIAYAYKHDAVLLAHAGNDSGQHSYYPASFDGVIGVSGIRNRPYRPTQTTFGPLTDLAAPAGDIAEDSNRWVISLNYPDGYTKVWATEYACAHVAGAASLLRGTHPELCNDDIANVLQLSARDIDPPGYDIYFGHGLVKVDSAFRILQAPNTLRHLTVTSTPSVYSVSDAYPCTFYELEGLAAGIYFVKRYEIHADVTFPQAYYSLAGAWGRGNSTVGFGPGNPNLGIGFAEFVPGTLTESGGTIRASNKMNLRLTRRCSPPPLGEVAPR